ncbi:hypothetical protein BCV70DRAFT_200521 [Testicularia cyperi]|uniref:HD/PDEase domain-containing protein n=1 Tax=Testicularia cyperi TaxID=1882483 RepID=A0A317XNY6_9BASI|nr:hypothetical protein BCV70DRAFT_200521 [Testicularia cyperi]
MPGTLVTDLADSTSSLTLSETSTDQDARDAVIRLAEDFVREAFKAHDPSHDFHHVHRVRLLSLALSNSPEVLGHVDLLVLELGALFHDLVDRKYSSSDKSPSSVLAPFWQSVSELAPASASTEGPPTALVTEAQRATVESIVENVSWSKDVRRRQAREQAASQDQELSLADKELDSWLSSCKEFWCVSDADRLDSIGSIGILRCAAYSGIANRPLYIPPNNPAGDSRPPAEQGQGYNGSAIAHFYEKLVKIRDDRLFTSQARLEASRRQQMMDSFLTELDLEWMMASQGAELAKMQ